MHFMFHGPMILTDTGCPRSRELEVHAPNQQIVDLWNQLLELGAAPIGLGTKDALRLELFFWLVKKYIVFF